jgi:hypothetical protein
MFVRIRYQRAHDLIQQRRRDAAMKSSYTAIDIFAERHEYHSLGCVWVIYIVYLLFSRVLPPRLGIVVAQPRHLVDRRIASEHVFPGLSLTPFTGFVKREEGAEGVVVEERAREESIGYAVAFVWDLPFCDVCDGWVGEEGVAPFMGSEIFEVFDATERGHAGRSHGTCECEMLGVRSGLRQTRGSSEVGFGEYIVSR